MQKTITEPTANETSQTINKNKEKINTIIPVCVVLICGLIVLLLLRSAISGVGNIDGLFILSGATDSSFIKLDADGSYQWSSNETKESGEWSFEDNKLVLTSSEGNKQVARIVDQKYIAIVGADFLSGEIPEGALFDAEVLSESGEVYNFKADGKIYTTYEGRNTEYGTYMTDGHFVIVTTPQGSITYLNCGDGVTSVFYKAS